MNTFIKEKSSSRKTILSNFLSLDLYEDLYKLSREDYIVLKNNHKNSEEKNWNDLIEQKNNEINTLSKESLKIKDTLSSLRDKEVEIKLEINNIEKNNKEHHSGYSLEKVKKEIDHIKNKICSDELEIINLNDNLAKEKDTLQKIRSFKLNYSIKNLEEDKIKLDLLKNKLKSFKRDKIFLGEDLNRNKNSLKILEEVPCDESFSSCKFIKDAYKSKENINTLLDEIKEIEVNILEINSAVNSIEKENLEEKIKKFNEILNKEYKSSIDLERNKEKLDLIKEKLNINNEKLEKLQIIKNELNKTSNEELCAKIKSLKQGLNEISSDIYDNENLIVINNKNQYQIENYIINLEKEKENYYSVIDQWKTYDLFSHSVSKKGIPTMLINNSLPLINKEINNILSGVTNFSINIEDEGSSLNVYIDYGDSKRIIECASGMEKMITSIAIRVALINISSLPKSDIFIIDEGFGALDDSNIESCSRLLTSLKKYFKTILIISHVDSIKDIVDKNIEISKKGNDSYVYHT